MVVTLMRLVSRVSMDSWISVAIPFTSTTWEFSVELVLYRSATYVSSQELPTTARLTICTWASDTPGFKLPTHKREYRASARIVL